LNKTIISTILLVLCISSCTNKDKVYTDIIATIEPKSGKAITAYENVIILPELGCEGCISDVENFLMNDAQHLKETFFILTRIRSLKLLKLRLGEKVLNQPHVVIDEQNLFEASEIHTIYPARLLIDESGQVEEVILKEPSNVSFFDDLF